MKHPCRWKLIVTRKSLHNNLKRYDNQIINEWQQRLLPSIFMVLASKHQQPTAKTVGWFDCFCSMTIKADEVLYTGKVRKSVSWKVHEYRTSRIWQYKLDATGCKRREDKVTTLWTEGYGKIFHLCQAGLYEFCPMLMWLSGSSRWNYQGLCKDQGTWCGWNWCIVQCCTAYPCRVPILKWCSISDGARQNWSVCL